MLISYQHIKFIGSGSYGAVISAMDKKLDEKVII